MGGVERMLDSRRSGTMGDNEERKGKRAERNGDRVREIELDREKKRSRGMSRWT